MTRSAGNRFRTRKLSTKQTLAILRENQIDSVDDDGQRNIPQIETGVERQEEIAAISAHQAAAVGSKDSKKVFIPTPNTTELSAEHYEKIYPKRFHQPFSYIRSSATVEDCCGTSYCMSAEDDKYLAKLNSTRKSTLSSITEDEFETIMDLYESTIQQTQPYLSMDVMNIIPFEELEHAFEENLDANLRAVAKSVYSYWKEQKISRGGRSIIPCLKFEQGNEKDEGDPYVCFRRREVRQVRKTRRTDAQSTEKLKKIRQEFETARGLVKDVLQREQMRRTSFVFEKQIFEQRRTAVELKRKLNIKDTDEDLVNKVCPKRTRTEPAAPPALRIPLRQDGKPPDADLRQLSTARAEDEKRRLEKYNQLRKLRPLSKYPMVDLTQDALFRQANPTTAPPVSNFCSVQTFYLPSPPHTAESTASSPGSGSISLRQGQVSIIQASPKKMPSRNLPTFRRRLGRGGRILIDRRGHASVSTDGVDPMVIDRIKFDNNDDEPDLVFPVDPYSDRQVKFRAQMLSPPPEHSLAQTPTIRRQVMASSPVVMTPGNSPANLLQRGMTNGHHPVPPHNPTMAHNAMQVNGHSTASFPTRR